MKTHRIPLFLLIIFALLICAGQAAAQGGRGKGRIQGIVLDEEGNPIESASVHMELQARETAERTETTNNKGEWAMIDLGSGTWLVTISKEGYIPTVSQVFVSQLQKNPRVVLRLKKPEISKDAVITDEASLAYIEQATQLYNNKEYDQALTILEQFLEKNPKAYQVQLLMGDCYREKGEIDKAIEVYTKAVEEAQLDAKMGDQVKPKAFATLGDAYLRKNDLEKAQQYFKMSVDADPEDANLAYNVGEIYFSGQQLDGAVEYFTKATQIKPEWATPYYKLGLVSLNKADYEKAKEHFRKFLTLEPEGEMAAQTKNILETLEKMKE